MHTSIFRRLIAATVAAVAAVTTLGAQTSVSQPAARFRSSADVVSIQASVRDKRGRPLQSLTPADFEIRDNGQLRQILSMRADRRSPVSLAILADMSGSMRVAAKMAMARQALTTLLSQLRDGQDEVALFTFDSELHERQPFTTDLTQLRGALDVFEPFGTTSLYDATAATARRLAERSATHKAIIILTDGVDTSSAMSASQVSGLASSIDVPVYVVATVPSIDQTLMTAPERAPRTEGADLSNLAEWTGGQIVFASSFVETAVVAAGILDELRQRYVIAIEAANTTEWRRLEIRVKHPSATVKARSGYFGG